MEILKIFFILIIYYLQHTGDAKFVIVMKGVRKSDLYSLEGTIVTGSVFVVVEK